MSEVPFGFETEPWELEDGALDGVWWANSGGSTYSDWQAAAHPGQLSAFQIREAKQEVLYRGGCRGGASDPAFAEALQVALNRTQSQITREYASMIRGMR